MKTKFRKPFSFRLSLYAAISICWFEMLMHTCIFAKSYYSRISPRIQPLFNRQPKSPPFPFVPSDTWEPRVKISNNNPRQLVQSQSILLDKMASTFSGNLKGDILPQMDPSNDDTYWEMQGDCKVSRIKIHMIRLHQGQNYQFYNQLFLSYVFQKLDGQFGMSF